MKWIDEKSFGDPIVDDGGDDDMTPSTSSDFVVQQEGMTNALEQVQPGLENDKHCLENTGDENTVLKGASNCGSLKRDLSGEFKNSAIPEPRKILERIDCNTEKLATEKNKKIKISSNVKDDDIKESSKKCKDCGVSGHESKYNKKCKFYKAKDKKSPFGGEYNNHLASSLSPAVLLPLFKKKPPDPQKLEEFLLRIFDWNPAWLSEQKTLSFPPPIVQGNPRPLKTIYPSYGNYYYRMEPLLALEVWSGISREFDTPDSHLQHPKLKTTFITNSVSTLPIKKNSNLYVTTFQVEAVISKSLAIKKTYPASGDLVMCSMEMNTSGEIHNIFTYVTSIRSTVIETFTEDNKYLWEHVKNPHTLLLYTMKTKPQAREYFKMYCPSSIQSVYHLSSDIRMIQALQYLPSSPLIKKILDPVHKDYRLPIVKNYEKYQLVTKDNLNKKQLEAVVRITKTVVQRLPRICMIQGPPGTGKSKVIVNIITEILYGNNRYKNGTGLMRILVCAPSNAAIDEVALRLLAIRKNIEDNEKFTIVRTGRQEAMHESVKPISLTELAKYHVEDTDDIDERKMRKLLKDSEKTVLEGADIIACTLSSCYTNQMEALFSEIDQTISVCIVDEATQSTEAETLIPLMLGVKTMVLVGDPNQLPATVLSTQAKKLGLDKSLFSRLYERFERKSNNPLIFLDTQYRMADPISNWPNRYFYKGALKNNAPKLSLPFHNYRVLNLESVQGADKYDVNSDEATFVTNLIYTIMTCNSIEKHPKPLQIGIITPYNNQKKVIIRKLREKMMDVSEADRQKIKLEVNTVDSFQGQERDIIIMSCVRSNGIGFLSDRQRLNVALTRAKHSLFICGNFKTFEKNRMWNDLLIDAKSRDGVYANVNSKATPNEIRKQIIKYKLITYKDD